VGGTPRWRSKKATREGKGGPQPLDDREKKKEVYPLAYQEKRSEVRSVIGGMNILEGKGGKPTSSFGQRVQEESLGLLV